MKKWSYVAAAFLTVASGMALTSCIDNDEPFGIEQIRLATASLLEAKKAATDAEAAAKSAQVEIDKLKIEAEKLRIENEKILAQAEAKIKEAEAKYKEAQAQAELLRAEGQKAIDDAEAAKKLAEAEVAQAEADKWKAEAEQIRKQAEGDLAEKMQQVEEAKQRAEDLHNKAVQGLAEAVYRFEKEKAYNENAWNQELWGQVQDAFYAYLGVIDAYNSANQDYMEALNEMAKIDADLIWVEEGEKYIQIVPVYGPDGDYLYDVWQEVTNTESGFKSPNYDKKAKLDQQIAAQKAVIAAYENQLAILNNYKEQLSQLKAKLADETAEFEKNDWYVLLSEYQANMDAAKEAIEQANLELQALKLDNADVYAAPGPKEAAYNSFMAANIPVAPLAINPLPEVLTVMSNGWSRPVTIIPGGQSYTLNDYPNGNNRLLDNFQSTIDREVRNLKLAKLDQNDVVWTEARKTEMERQLAASPWGKDKTLWETARNVYNKGGVPKKDLLPNEAAVEAAINAYNALAPQIKPLLDAISTASTTEGEKSQAYQDALATFDDTNAKAVLEAAIKAFDVAVNGDPDAEDTRPGIEIAYWETMAEAQKDIDAAYDQFDYNKKSLYHVWKDAEIAQMKLMLGKPTAAQIAQAQQAVDKAEQNYLKYVQETGPADIQKVVDSVAAKSEAAKADAYQAMWDAADAVIKAQEAFNAVGGHVTGSDPEGENWGNIDGSDYDKTKDPAYAAVNEAFGEWQDAVKALQGAKTAYDKFYNTKNTGVVDLYKAMTKAVADQLKAMGLGAWSHNTIPAQYDYLADGKTFKTASIPVMYLNDDQIYENAKEYVRARSVVAFGNLLIEEDINDFDLENDDIMLIEDATNANLLAVVDEYIKKNILWNNPYLSENDITQFDIAALYASYGTFGEYSDLMVKIAYAGIVIANKDNSAIDQWIKTLNDASAAMWATYNQKLSEKNVKYAEWQQAENAIRTLEANARAALRQAEDLYHLYGQIINGVEACPQDPEDHPVSLAAWVASLKNDALGSTQNAITKVNGLISSAQSTLNGMADNLALAQELLEKYEYQLAQYESSNYGEMENPYKYTVDYLAAKVAKLADEMAFWKQRYEELQAQYDAAKKSASYPD